MDLLDGRKSQEKEHSVVCLVILAGVVPELPPSVYASTTLTLEITSAP